MKTSNNINILTYGGLGDTLLLTPALTAFKEKYPSSSLTVFCLHPKHKEVLKHNPCIDKLRDANFWSAPFAWIKFHLKILRLHSYNYIWIHPTRTYSINITEIIAELLGVQLADQKMRVFLTEAEEKNGRACLSKYTNPITINPSTEGTKNKEWFAGHWEQLISSMPQYSFIQLGLAKDELVKGAIDMRGISIRDSMAVIKASMCYVGIDSFMAHAATAVSTPAVVLFGATQPAVFGSLSNLNLYTDHHCSPCFETLVSTPCPYGRKCMERIKARQVKKAILEKIGKEETTDRKYVAETMPTRLSVI